MNSSLPYLGRHHINGQWLTADPARVSATHSPIDHRLPVGVFPEGTEAEMADAVAAARAALSAWRRTSRLIRGEKIEEFARIIRRDTQAFAGLMALEIGKPINEARAEVIEGMHMALATTGLGWQPSGHTVASEIPEKDATVLRKPKGVVGLVTPWNFPFAVPLWMMLPALLEGNTVVWKPSPLSQAMAGRMMEALLECGFPPGVINLVYGDAGAGSALVANPGVNAVLFTGSYEVGKRIREASAGLPDRHVAAEMGGKNAVIVCRDARIDLAVNAAILSAFKTSGQRCVSASRLIVHASLVEEFSMKFVAKAKRLVLGDPRADTTFMGPLINATAISRVLAFNELARNEGADVLLAGGRSDKGDLQHGHFASPFVYRMPYSPASRCLREEVFGPHVAIVPFETIDEAIRIHNGTEYGLSMALITEDYRLMKRFREECEFGMGYVNLPCIGAEVHLPFGGMKKSGNGQPSAAGILNSVTSTFAWTVNHAEEIRMAQGLKVDV